MSINLLKLNNEAGRAKCVRVSEWESMDWLGDNGGGGGVSQLRVQVLAGGNVRLSNGSSPGFGVLTFPSHCDSSSVVFSGKLDFEGETS